MWLQDDGADLDFVYNDTDCHQNEIAELYSYAEHRELLLNFQAFKNQMEDYHLPPDGKTLTDLHRLR